MEASPRGPHADFGGAQLHRSIPARPPGASSGADSGSGQGSSPSVLAADRAFRGSAGGLAAILAVPKRQLQSDYQHISQQKIVVRDISHLQMDRTQPSLSSWFRRG